MVVSRVVDIILNANRFSEPACFREFKTSDEQQINSMAENLSARAKPQSSDELPFWMVLFLTIILTCIVANTITISFQSGMFTIWRSLPPPPLKTTHIIDADGDNVWIGDGEGNLYTLTLYCSGSDDCHQWVRLDDVENIDPLQCHPVQRGPDCRTLSGAFSPNNPSGGKVHECIVADGCFPDPEYGSETYFALMADGSVKYWKHGNGLLGFSFFFVLSTISDTTAVLRGVSGRW